MVYLDELEQKVNSLSSNFRVSEHDVKYADLIANFLPEFVSQYETQLSTVRTVIEKKTEYTFIKIMDNKSGACIAGLKYDSSTPDKVRFFSDGAVDTGTNFSPYNGAKLRLITYLKRQVPELKSFFPDETF